MRKTTQARKKELNATTGPPPDVVELALQVKKEGEKENPQGNLIYEMIQNIINDFERNVFAGILANDEKNLKEVIKKITKLRQSHVFSKRIQHSIVYKIEEATFSLFDEEAVEKMKVDIFGMRGEHAFLLDESTKVSFEVQNFALREVLGNSASLRMIDYSIRGDASEIRTPCLRAEAETAPPIIVIGTR